MKNVVRSLAVLILTVAVAVPAMAGVTESFEQTYSVSSGASVSLANVNGDVTIEVWDRDEVWVRAEKVAPTAERLAGLRIEVNASADSVRIETRYPRTNGPSNGKTEVTYHLTVPRNAEIDEIDLVNGDLELTGVAGRTEAENVNGTITVREASGGLELSTVNGSIKAFLRGLSADDEAVLESVNGHIHVHIQGGADLDAETVNGKIRNDFGLEVHKGKYVGADLRGAVNGGGVRVNVETVNGGITFHAD